VFDYILPIYFMVLYNTTGMSHLKNLGTVALCCSYGSTVYTRVKLLLLLLLLSLSSSSSSPSS